MYGRSLHGNREISWLAKRSVERRVRGGKARSRSRRCTTGRSLTLSKCCTEHFASYVAPDFMCAWLLSDGGTADNQLLTQHKFGHALTDRHPGGSSCSNRFSPTQQLCCGTEALLFWRSENGICSTALISVQVPRACAQRVLSFCFLRRILVPMRPPGWTWDAFGKLQVKDGRPVRDRQPNGV
jgi:hypothetical protein